MLRYRPVSLALVGLFLFVIGCTSYKQIEPGEVMDHDRVRVTMTNGERHDIYDPVLEADSIRGTKQVYRYSASTFASFVIPLDQVATLESAHGDAGESIGMGFSELMISFSSLPSW